MIKSALLFLCAFVTTLSAEDTAYNLSICAIFKNEAPWFREWIEYHRIVGVDHFYLYNNGSTDNFMETLGPYIKSGIVTIIDWPNRSSAGGDEKYHWVKTTQLSAYEHGCKVSAAGKTKWLAMIDVDEFMVPVKAKTMTELLEKYKDAVIVTLLWHIFGTSNVNKLPDKTLLVEALHLTSFPNFIYNSDVRKTIIRPESYCGFSWPPHLCNLKEGKREIALEKNEAQLNHYMNRTLDYFYHQKVKSKEDMNNRKLTEEEIASWRNMGNDIEDFDKYIHRYIPQLRQRLGYDSIP